MRNAEQVVNEIHSALADGDKQGLRNTAALLEALQARPACPVIHVAGTNGKGSVCAMLSSMLAAAGYRTGLYTSPFLQTYRERIRINGEPVSEALLAKYGNETLDAAARLREEKGWRCTPFELGTALAFRTFRQEGAEIIVCETGMGGRLDPTNAVEKPAVCVITAIGMDHMQYLGNSLAQIAREKAGIMKPGVPAVCSPPESEEVRQVLEQAAAERGCPLTILRRDQVRPVRAEREYSVADFRTEHAWRPRMTVSLAGEHQLVNALTALAAADELEKQGIRIPEEAVYRGMAETRWPGRLEWHGNILMDGAHNAQGIRALRNYVRTLPEGGRRVLLAGVLREKLTDEMPDMLADMADEAVTVTPDSPRALPAEELSAMLAEKGLRARPAAGLQEGLAAARAAAGEDGTVVATGSLYFIGSLRSGLGLKP